MKDVPYLYADSGIDISKAIVTGYIHPKHLGSGYWVTLRSKIQRTLHRGDVERKQYEAVVLPFVQCPAWQSQILFICCALRIRIDYI